LNGNGAHHNTGVGGGESNSTGVLTRLTTGANNTALGYGAGAFANTTSSNNVFLGNQSGPTTATVLSNKLYIDNSANDTPLVYGDFTDNYLRINNILELPEIATPADPASGYGRVYFKTDGLYYKMGSTETKVGTGTGGMTSLGGLSDAA